MKFLARGRGYALFLTTTDAVLVLNPPAQRPSRRERGQIPSGQETATPSIVTMRLVGAGPAARVTALERLPGASHYLIGPDPKRWHRGVPAYARVRYDDVYPGVSLVYYGNEGHLEYDFVVAPGADPGAIVLELEGATGLRVDERGDLMIGTARGDVRLHRPLVYQEIDGGRRELEGGYTVEDGRRVRFRVAAWDASRPLVIDPVLAYSTYLGGGSDDQGFGIAVDVDGSAYITGSTISADFPTAGALQAVKSGVTDAFITKLDASGSNVVYSTYLGGNGDDAGNAIALDATGNAYVAGQTSSTNFPFVNAFQTTRRNLDGFLAKIDPTGANLVYSTLLGGSADDVILGVAVDGVGDAVVTGSTLSTDFPTASALQATKRAGSEAFVAKFTAGGAGLVYSTFLGGGGDDIGSAVAVDASGNVYVVGSTTSTNFPVVGAFQSVKAAATDAFVAKLDGTGAALVFSTYLGGAGDDEGNAIAVASDGSAVTVVGNTTSTNFPTSGPIQPANAGTTDAFVTRLAGAGNGLLFSTYLGGTAVDLANGVAVHSDGSTYVVGTTRSTNFPVFNPITGGSALAGGADVFVTKLTPTGLTLGFSTYLGAAGDETGNAVALDADGLAYVAGSTNSTAFPTVDPAQGSLGGGLDAFVAQIADGGILQFSAPTFTVLENAGTATVIVTRTGDHTSAVTVNYTTSNGVAIAGSDYVSTTGTLAFAPGETAKTFTVPLIDDSDGEGDETFLVTLSAPTGGAVLGARKTASVKIVDDEASVNFSTGVYTATEGNGAVITVVRSGPAPLAGTVLVGYVTEDGTATGGAAGAPGADYVVSTGTLTFGPGVTTRTFTVPTVNDSLAESTETVRLRLTSVSGGTPPALLGVRAAATLNIDDNDAGGVLQFSAPTFSVAESTPTATITVTRSGGAASNVTVDFATSDGTAQAGVNYVTTSGTLTFAAGTTSRTFTVPIINNTAAQGNVRANLTLSNATGGAQLGSRSTAALTVVDDEPNISFTTDTFLVSEAATAATITLRRGGVATSTVKVDFTTSDFTAVAGVDYVATAGTLTFGPGVLSQSFKVAILNNRLADGARTLRLSLTNPQGGVAVVDPSVAALQIGDDDPGGTIQFSAATYTVLENVGAALVSVIRSSGTAGAVTVDYATSDGTATAGLDYTPQTGTLTFGIGETSKTFSVPIVDDTTPEGAESINLTLSNAHGGTLGLRSTAVLQVADDELTVQFGAAAYTVNEGAGFATISVVRTGTSPAPISVNYAASSASGATATASADYVPVSGTLTFAPGVNVQTFQVPILQDTIAEGAETVTLALGSPLPSPAVQLAPNATAVLTIVDDDVPGTVKFAADTFSVSESIGSGLATVTVARTGGDASGVVVSYATGDGTASAGSDYLASAGSVTFGFGETTKTFTIPILNDAIAEGTETVNLTLTVPGGAGSATLGSPSSAVLNITDDEPHLQFSSATYTVGEGGGFAVVTVHRGGVLTATVTVDYTTEDQLPTATGKAQAGVDYTAVAGTLTFGPGVDTRTFSVPILNDGLIEGDEALTLRLRNAGGATLVAPVVAELKITDNDTGGKIQFSNASFSVNEDGGEAVVTVVRSGGAGIATVDYTTADQAAGPGKSPATAGTDYTATSGTLTFGPGETKRTFVVPILTDALAEGTETLDLKLTNPQPASLTGSPTLDATDAAVLSIVDAAPTVQFTAATFDVQENIGLATITVERTGSAAAAAQTVKVDFQTVAGGTAVANADFTPVSGTLTFGPGVTTTSFKIPIIDNKRVEADKTLNLSLTNPVNATIAPRGTAVVNLKEDDQGGAFAISAPPVGEAGGYADVTVTRTGGTATGITVDYSADVCGLVAPPCDFPARKVALDALHPEHFTATSGTLTFNEGEMTKTFRVFITNNSIPEGSRDVGLAIGNAQPAGLPNSPTLGSPNALLHIVEDELHFVFLSSENYSASESAGSTTITIQRTGLSTVVDSTAVTVNYVAVAGSAAAGVDFTPVAGSVVMAAGVRSATFTVPLIDDTVVDGEKTVFVGITSVSPSSIQPNGAAIAFPGSGTLTINDDDVGGTIQFQSATYNVAESGVNAVISLTRTGGLAGGVTVDYETGDLFAPVAPIVAQTATAGSDYTSTLTGCTAPAVRSASSLTACSVTFGPGDTARTFVIPIAADVATEGTETVNLRLLNPRPTGAGAPPTLGTQTAAVLRIIDTTSTVFFSTASYDVSENAGTATITVERAGPAGLPGTVTVGYATVAGGTAVAGTDYTAVAGTLTFGPGQSLATFTLPILDNAVIDADKTISLELSAPTGGASIPGTCPGTPATCRGQATLNVTDDDAGGVIKFAADTFTILENAGAATITLTRSGGNGIVMVDYATSDPGGLGSAAAGSDYTASSGTVTFGAGQKSLTFTVPILDDALAEGLERVTLTLSNPQPQPAGVIGRLPTIGAPNPATLQIVDDESEFRFGAASYTVNEAGGAAVITVVRTGSLQTTSTVDYRTGDVNPTPPAQTAVAGADYTSTFGTLTFIPGVDTLTFTIPIADDVLAEAAETVVVELVNASPNASIGTPGTATLTILDNDSGGVVQFSTAVYTIAESGTAIVTVTRQAGAAGDVLVDFATTDGTAVAPGDYTPTSGTLTFAAGQATQTFPVTVGDVGPGTRTVLLSLTNAQNGGAIGSPALAVLEIVDAANTVEFTAADYVVQESAGIAVVTAVRTGTTPMSVQYRTIEGAGQGTATPVTDYTPASGTLSFAAGVTRLTFSVPIVRDAVLEGPETVNLELLNPVGAVLAPQSTATITVTDDDFGGTIEFASSNFTVNEGGGTAAITVLRGGGSAGSVTIDVMSSDPGGAGSATAGSDYTALVTTVTFAPGETTKTVTVTILEDAVTEGGEALNLTLSNPQPAGFFGSPVVGPRSTAVLNITDDEPVFSFANATFTAGEGTPSATITVERGGNSAVVASVDWAATAGTAVAGVDFTPGSGTLAFAAGETVKTFTVALLPDSVVDGSRSVVLTLSNPLPAGGSSVAGTNPATLQIVDDDRAGAIQFSASSYTVNETAGTATITVTRTGGVADNVVAFYQTSGGRPGVDYTATSGNLTFLAGETAKTFPVTILNNGTGDDPALKVVTLNVIPLTPGATFGVPSQATLHIVDDEFTVQFISPGFVVAESGGLATITVKRNGPLTGTVTVQYATADGTATGGAVTGPGIDYLTRSGTLTFGPGVATRTFTVPIVNDTAVEGNETIVLTLSSPLVVGGGVMSIVGTNPATLAILDNDQGGFIEFDSATYTVIENAGFAQIKVKRTGGLASGVTVQYATNDGVGTALAGADYTPTNNTLTFAAGELTKTFTIPIFNDTIDEGNETVVLVLSGAGGGGSLGARDTATLTIVDDDTAGVVQFSAPVYTVSEAATQATITVKRTGGLATGLGATGITVDYATSDGTATAGSDYTATTGSVTFAAGQLTATFTIPLPADDPTKEGNETVLLTLSNPQGGATLGLQKTALLKIVDNENSTVQFNAATYTVLEGGSAVVTVERTGTAGLPGTVTVQYAAAAGGPTPATPVVDFTPVAGTLTFGPGVATRTFSVPTKTNAVPSGARTIALTLSNTQPLATAILAPQSTAVLSIVDNDAGGQIQWSSANYQAREGAGLMYLIAKRTGGLAGGVTVPYTVVDGTARAGQHFTLASGTLRFAAGAVQVNVPTLITPQNTVETGPLTFTVVMGTPQPAGFATSATLGSPSTATVTIVDDDEGGVVQFGVLSVRVAENAALCTALPPANACAKVTVTRTGGAASAVTADYSMADGTAVANVHYVQTSGQVSFAAGQTSATIPVQLINDGTNNGLRTFTITLSNARGGATIGVNSSLQVQIADND